MMFSKSVFFTLFAASGVLSQFTWKDCGSPHGQINSIQAVPAVPQKGKSFKINGSGVILKDAQTIKLDVQMKDLPVIGDLNLQENACGPIEVSTLFGGLTFPGLSCPLKAGAAVDLSATVTLGRFVPSGSYTAVLKATDEGGNTLMCLETVLTLGAKNRLLPEPMPTTEGFFNNEIGQAVLAQQRQNIDLDQIKAAIAGILANLQGAQGRSVTPNHAVQQRLDLDQIKAAIAGILANLQGAQGRSVTPNQAVQQRLDLDQIKAALAGILAKLQGAQGRTMISTNDAVVTQQRKNVDIDQLQTAITGVLATQGQNGAVDVKAVVGDILAKLKGQNRVVNLEQVIQKELEAYEKVEVLHEIQTSLTAR